MSSTKKAQAGTGTVRITRVIRAPRERVYNAFLDPDALAKWLPPGGYTARVHHLEPKVGGTWRMSFTSLDKKESHSFGGEYLELRPHELIRNTDRFETDHPDMQGTITVTITFRDVPGGTEVTVLQEGIPKVIPEESALQGWTQSMDNLARLVEEPGVPGGAAADTSLRVVRVIRAPRDKVYAAFLDRASPALARFAPNQVPGEPMEVVVHHLEPRVGGRVRLSMVAKRGAHQGTHTGDGRYLELVPGERIVHTHRWEGDPANPETKVTITLRDVPGGTEVTLVHEGLPGRESVEAHLGGWTEALANFGQALAPVAG